MSKDAKCRPACTENAAGGGDGTGGDSWHGRPVSACLGPSSNSAASRQSCSWRSCSVAHGEVAAAVSTTGRAAIAGSSPRRRRRRRRRRQNHRHRRRRPAVANNTRLAAAAAPLPNSLPVDLLPFRGIDRPSLAIESRCSEFFIFNLVILTSSSSLPPPPELPNAATQGPVLAIPWFRSSPSRPYIINNCKIAD